MVFFYQVTHLETKINPICMTPDINYKIIFNIHCVYGLVKLMLKFGEMWWDFVRSNEKTAVRLNGQYLAALQLYCFLKMGDICSLLRTGMVPVSIVSWNMRCKVFSQFLRKQREMLSRPAALLIGHFWLNLKILQYEVKVHQKVAYE